MNSQQKERLDEAIEALRTDLPDPEDIQRSASHVADRLGLAASEAPVNVEIWNCKDLQRFAAAYRQRKLSPANACLIDAHLRECGQCLRVYREVPGSAGLDWSTPSIVAAGPRLSKPAMNWAFALAAVALIATVFVYRFYWAIPPGVRAEVISLDGSAYLVGDHDQRAASVGGTLGETDQLRTAPGSRAVLRLADGSLVDVNQRTALQIGARGRSMTVALDAGSVIVNAAHRQSGHLYVKTPDCRATVQGTVFSVNSGLKGSRVAVLQGTVRVAHAGAISVLHPGEQVATNASLAPASVEEQISWSPERVRYLQLLADFSVLRNRIGQIPFPQVRYASDILPRVPSDTLLYISVPNLGEFLAEANTIFRDQLDQSPALQEWWSRGHKENTAKLNDLVGELHDVSQYIGEEAVVVGEPRNDHPDFAIVADVARSGLADLLRQQFSAQGLAVYTPETLSTTAEPSAHKGEYVLVRQHEAVFATSLEMLRQWNVRLDAGASGFADSDFGKQIASSYTRGAGIILAADLHQMLASGAAAHKGKDWNALPSSGVQGVQYLIAEHREQANGEENHLNVTFTGQRQRVASWLGSPAPMSSLEFISPNAGLAGVILSKDPKQIADDILSMAENGKDGKRELDRAQQEMQINLRDDLAATLGGEFLIALDGPVLPVPSWKAVIEVNDFSRLQNTLERLASFSAQQARGPRSHSIVIDSEDASGQRFFTVRDRETQASILQYTFARGYMIVAPNRALLLDALRTQQGGDSLARSASFRALLPRDDNENYSAVLYQNLGPVLNPLLSQLSGESADAVRKLAADARPTAICAWGKDNRIEVASDSRLFGFDFLTLGALLDSRNKHVGPHVIR